MTTTLHRTDVHRPSAIVPSDYDYVGFEVMKVFDLGSALILQEERARIERHMARTGGKYSTHEHGGNCGVCGSPNAVYTVLFHHRPSNTYVRMGQDCAEKCDMAYYTGSLDAFKTSVKDARELQAGKRKAEAILADEGLSAAWTIYLGTDAGREELTVKDIVGKLVRYGSISEKQVAFLRRLLDTITNRAAITAQRAAEKASAPHWTAGRQNITGTILKVSEQETQFGLAIKAFIKLADGRTCWGTMSKGERGDTVTFAAAIEPVANDPTHAFFRRPTCIVVAAAPTSTEVN